MGDNNFYSLDGPLESMPSERQMRVANLTGFAPLVRSLGADPRAILERHEIDPRFVRDPDHYIDCKSMVDMLEYCSTSLNDPLFGLQLARQQEPDIYGCVTALCRAASTMREALQSFINYIPVTHSPATVIELVEGSQTAELRWCVRTDLGKNSQANYQAAMLNIKLLRQIGGKGFQPNYVNLGVDARNRDIQELERQLGCRFHNTATENAIAFPAAYLDQPIATSSRLLFRLLGGYLDRVKAASRHSDLDRVQDYIRSSLASGGCSIERCAEKLGTSVRTLQSRLSEAGLSFSELLEEQRMSLAQSYLKQDQFSLDDVAANLGYSEQSSFGRAFKRWTGVTPKQYRRQYLN
ncbi:AraC family transcriptional regulator [Zhongshania aquimaris]|uniref:AraC family transcriptional regulator n=1 Tax=Zhongshania aquimaris TaxID=2857107 RepID=A0ABS6VVZ0_9GAMM|nr:AraC family transcriptional regulator [Zhongshania aquimaris]MBW2942504.1 AraC family transcriptional regulator [Zhongshania aquimaris]